MLSGAACGGADEGSSSSFVASRENPVRGVVRALCERGAQCVPDSGLEDLLFRAPYGGDVDLCVEVTLYASGPVEAAYIDAVARGEFQLADEDLRACLALLTRCEPLQPEDLGTGAARALTAQDGVSACLRLVGTLTGGMPCSLQGACASGLYCDFEEASCPGVCRPQAVEGAACRRDAECLDTDPLRISDCEAGRCVVRDVEIAPVAARGEPCGVIKTDEVRRYTSCEADSYCQCSDAITEGGFLAALLCGNRGTCAAPIPVGQSCRSLIDVCERGATCPEDTCVPADDLFPWAGGDQPRPSPRELISLQAGESCVPPALFEEDGPRRDFIDLRLCRRGLFCDASSATCQPQRDGGEACREGFDCASGQCTDGVCADQFCSVTGL